MILFRYKMVQQSIIKHTEVFNTASLIVLNSHEALTVYNSLGQWFLIGEDAAVRARIQKNIFKNYMQKLQSITKGERGGDMGYNMTHLRKCHKLLAYIIFNQMVF